MSKRSESSDSAEFGACLVLMKQVGSILERCESAGDLDRLSEAIKKLSWVAHCLARHQEWTAAGKRSEAKAALNLIALYLTEVPPAMRWR